MYKFKKLMSSVSLICILILGSYQPSYAWSTDQIVSSTAFGAAAGGSFLHLAGVVTGGLIFSPVILSTGVFMAVVAGGAMLYYYDTQSSKSADANNVYLQQNAQWVDLDSVGNAVVKQKTGGQASVKNTDIIAAVQANPNAYPNLNNVLQPFPAGTTTISATDGGTYGVGATRISIYGNACDIWDGYESDHWEHIANYSSCNGADTLIHVQPYGSNAHSNSYYAPIYPTVPSSTGLCNSIVTSPTNNSVKSSFSGDIDKLLQNTPNIVHFDDPGVTPPSTTQLVNSSATAAQTAASAAAASAQQASNSASAASQSVAQANQAYSQAAQANQAAQAAVTSAQTALANAQTQAQVASAQAALAQALQQAQATQQAANAAAQAADNALIAAATGNGQAISQALQSLAGAQQALANVQAVTNSSLGKDNKVGSSDDDGDGIIGWLRQIRDAVNKVADDCANILQKITDFFGDGKTPTVTPPTTDQYKTDVSNSDGSAPQKKDLGDLLSRVVSSSPLVSLAKSVTLSVSDEQSLFSCTLWGKQIDLDFSQWSGVLNACGAGMLAVSHIYAVMCVFRRED